MIGSEFTPEKMSVVMYPHPVLRHPAKPIKRVDADLKRLASRMIELMYEHRGVGLAAPQVNLPLQMFVWDPTGDRERGQAMVLLNPTISRPRSSDEAEEGCLSLPGLYANVIRAKTIHLNAYDINGKEINSDVSGFEARVLQHEIDHLHGMLFIDRLSPQNLREHEVALQTFTTDFQSRQRVGSIPSEPELREHILHWEQRYT